MGRRKSKNQNASAVYTHGEMNKIKYGDQTQRLGLDSQLKINCCRLCLGIVQQPHVCQKGHLFCKECIVKNLLEQKKEMQQQIVEKVEVVDGMEDKRKLFMSAQQFVEQEQETLKDVKINDWIVRGVKQETKTKKLDHTMCTVRQPHPLSLKKLVPLKTDFSCLVCKKEFKNGTKIVVIDCGHVYCGECIRFSVEKCNDCGQITHKQIKLDTDGTGFSEKGNAQATKQDIVAIL
ncbi:hypothetical protein EDD86DRAFT_215392 [Gorgonomyces haynaldii]|nr:hypothetical protein EDD86DRAFT_215392 [Gorgonomyces haynaldii]